MKPLKKSYALLLSLSLLSPALAIQKSLAGVIDWHKPQLGIPRSDIPPAFTSSSGVYVVGEGNVFGAVDPTDGSINWRLRLDPETDPILGYAEDASAILLVSGTTTPTARLLSPTSGHVIWETLLAPPNPSSSNGAVDDQAPIIKFVEGGDVVVLYGGDKVERLERKGGERVWLFDCSALGNHGQWTLPSSSKDHIHLIAQTPSFSSSTLSHITLLLSTGIPTTRTPEHIDSTLSSPGSLLTTSNHTTSTAAVHWLENGVLKSVTVGEVWTSNVRSLTLGGDVKTQIKYTEIKDIGLAEQGYFLALEGGDRADLISAREAWSTSVVWRFEKEAACSPSSWSGYVNSRGQSYVTRLFWSCSMGLASLQTYSVDHEQGYLLTGSTLPFQDKEHGIIVDMATQIQTISPFEDAPTLLLTTSTGSIQLWYSGRLLWAREESLSDVRATTTVDLPERKVEDVRVLLEDEGMGARAVRHLQGLKDLPGFLLKFVSRFAGGTYTKALSSTPLSASSLFRDQFGFQKLVILGTGSGKVFAIDSAHGNTVWSALLGVSDRRGGRTEILEMWSVRGLGDVGNPMVAVVAVQKGENGEESTIGYHIDAFTGEIVKQKDEVTGELPPGGRKLFEGRPVESFALPIKHCKTHVRAVAVVDSESKVHLFPFCKKIESAFKNMSSSLSFSTSTATGLTGHAIVASNGEDGIFETYETWTLAIPDGQAISRIVKPSAGPVASFGRVLGDRSALYKYLNPHLVAFSTVDVSSASGQVYVIDTTTGAIVYEAAVGQLETKRGIEVMMDENWLVYSYDEMGDANGGEMGHRLVSVELYEAAKSESLSTSTAKGSGSIQTASRSFILTSGVKSLTATTSLHGITAKDLLFINDKDQVSYVPRRLLDPRRPIGVVSKVDKEEMLVPYEPLLPMNSRWIVSHNNQLIGVDKIVATPALLESTSLLISYGLDLFGSRVNPSGTFDILSDAFNKPQLVLTIIALVVGIAVAKPTVDRKMMRARWY